MVPKPELRPLRRIERGRWESRDGRFRFTNGRVTGAERDGSIYVSWHVHEKGYDPAYGEMVPTLRDAVGEVEYEYRLLELAPEGLREGILAYVAENEPVKKINELAGRLGVTYGIAYGVCGWLIFEGLLLDADDGYRVGNGTAASIAPDPPRL